MREIKMRYIHRMVWMGGLAVLICSNMYAQYYYSDNRQVPLLVDSSKISIAFVNAVIIDTIGSFVDNYERLDHIIDDVENIDDFKTFAINTAIGYEEFIDTLRNDSRVRTANPYYMYSTGEKLLIGETFCCKFFEATTYEYIDSLNNANGVDIVDEKYCSPKEFLLRINSNAVRTTLEMANYYYTLTNVEYSHPDFLGGFEMDGTPVYDYYWPEQWAMQRIFNASDVQPEIVAFDITLGSPDIVVAVLDDGVSVHEDLPASRILPGYDFCCGDDTPLPCDSPGYGFHGQACAGNIGAEYSANFFAQNNPNSGICGVAPMCKILPIKIWSTYLYDSLYTECCHELSFYDWGRAIDTAWIMGADILSSSWHFDAPVDNVLYATFRASLFGRGGYGCGIFHSTGNASSGDPTYPGIMNQVIAVGSIDPNDQIWAYSNFGKVDVVAPGGSPTPYVDKIWTTDQMGEQGGNGTGDAYNCGSTDDLDYLCNFTGTSSAQPVAAGVGALVLSRRPDLTGAQLRDVIRNSADPDMYVSITNPPDIKYGYGMVHPLQALLAVTRGDANNDGNINVADASYIAQYVFNGGSEPIPDVRIADSNCDGLIDLADAIYLINYAFRNGPPPPLCYKYDY